MTDDKLIEQLLDDLNRVIDPDRDIFRQAIAESGLPDRSQKMKYLPFNRQVVTEPDRTTQFSLMAVFNNRMAAHYKLTGVRKTLSQRIFALSRNHMDIFINKMRCDGQIISLMDAADGDYSLFGMLQVDKVDRSRFINKRYRLIRPVILIPEPGPEGTSIVQEFEKQNEVRKQKRFALPFFKTIKTI